MTEGTQAPGHRFIIIIAFPKQVFAFPRPGWRKGKVNLYLGDGLAYMAWGNCPQLVQQRPGQVGEISSEEHFLNSACPSPISLSLAGST